MIVFHHVPSVVFLIFSPIGHQGVHLILGLFRVIVFKCHTSGMITGGACLASRHHRGLLPCYLIQHCAGRCLSRATKQIVVECERFAARTGHSYLLMFAGYSNSDARCAPAGGANFGEQRPAVFRWHRGIVQRRGSRQTAATVQMWVWLVENAVAVIDQWWFPQG